MVCACLDYRVRAPCCSCALLERTTEKFKIRQLRGSNNLVARLFGGYRIVYAQMWRQLMNLLLMDNEIKLITMTNTNVTLAEF